MIKITTTDIKKHISTEGAFEVDVLLPYVGPADRRFLLPVLGLEMLKHIDTYSNAAEQKSEVLNELIDLCQRARILLAFDIGYPQFSVAISSYGIQRVETESKKSLFGYQERNLRESFRAEGYNAIEDIIAYLEANIDHADLQKWADSDVCANINSLLINSATEFTRYYTPLKNSRLVFLNTLSSQQFIIDQTISSIVPDAVLDKLQELIKDREINLPVNIEKKKLLERINKPLAYLTIADAIATLGAKYSDRGLMFTEVDAGIDNTSEKPTVSAISKVEKDAREKGNAYIKMLKDYLLEKNIVESEPVSTSGYDFFKKGSKNVRL